MNGRRDATVQSYLQRNLKASGRFGKTLNVQSPRLMQVQLWGELYTEALTNGRKPTENGAPPGMGILRGLIRKWIDDKRIQPKDNISKDSLAYLITRKIHREGIHIPNVGKDGRMYNDGQLLSSVFTPSAYNQLKSELGKNYISDIQAKIKTAWQL